MLCGGDKSTQQEDIEQAKRIAADWKSMGDKSERFTPYDSADYLTGIEDVAAYLEAAIEEAGDDPSFIAQALGTIARSGNLSAWRAGSGSGETAGHGVGSYVL